jgi:hypothetical protein
LEYGLLHKLLGCLGYETVSGEYIHDALGLIHVLLTYEPVPNPVNTGLVVKHLTWILSHEDPAVISSFIVILSGVTKGGTPHTTLLLQSGVLNTLQNKLGGDVQITYRILLLLNDIIASGVSCDAVAAMVV